MGRPLVLPPLCRTPNDAMVFAANVHANQIDKIGEPYFNHLDRVAHSVERKLMLWCQENSLEHSEGMQIAWLHDVVEDTPYTSADLVREGFSYEVSYGVEYLTKEAGRPYKDEIVSLCRNAPLPVLLVKLSDNEDNADPERLAKLDEATRARLLAKYEPSTAMLREAARAKGWQG